MRREELLETAEKIINGARQMDYGTARDNFTSTGRIWATILGIEEVTPEQVCLCMVALKLDRLGHSPDHQDSWIDIIGYAALGGEIGTGGS
jgi:hypothetical protein